MKVLVVNGSPRGANGNTEFVLERFLKGCKNAGADTEVVYLKDKDIKHCTGCFTCWTKTPGKCAQKDDMEELLVRVSEADIMVYATPLYYFTVTGIMKDFMDRMLPLNNREIVKVGNHYSHPRRNKRETPVKSVLISNCGFPGRYNFSGLLETFKVMTKGNLSGAILLAQGGALKAIDSYNALKTIYAPLLSALESAGEEIVKEGFIKPETQQILDTNVFSDEDYMKHANSSWA